MIFISTIWLFLTDVPLGLVAIVVFPLLVATNVIYERAVAVHFVDAQNRLHFRQVTLLRLEHDDVLVSDGLSNGELVCISPLQTVVDGIGHPLSAEAGPLRSVPCDGVERTSHSSRRR